MRNHLAKIFLAISILLLHSSSIAVAQEAKDAAETLILQDGSRLKGHLKVNPTGEPEFRVEGAQNPTQLEIGMTLLFENPPLQTVAGIPPFRVELGRGQTLSGRLESLTEEKLTLFDPIDNSPLIAARAGVQSLIQRPGEVQIFQDGFETIDDKKWAVVGEPQLVDTPREAGDHSLQIGSGGTSITHKLSEPFSSGRLELAFHDENTIAPGHGWWVDLAFRGTMGTQSIRVHLGWSEESLGVEAEGSTAFAVQRLLRKKGWHRLSIRFTSERCEISVDGNELALGKDLKGPLQEIRLASYQSNKAKAASGLSGHIDDLRLIRYDEPISEVEVDASQDEVCLTQGDQYFGKALVATANEVTLTIEDHPTTIGWPEVSGLFLKRVATQGREIEGLIARVEWQSTAGDDPRDRNVLEGAIRELNESSLTLDTAYCGALNITRERLRTIKLLGNAKKHRIEIDPKAHHLGNEISIGESSLDPPQPEGGILERHFELSKLPEGLVTLVVDAIKVVGEANDLPFSALVKKGELRTNLKINGTPFDYLNRLVTTKNESSERFRMAIPKESLRVGKNVIRFEQVGNANDPNYLDDLGILGIAIEY